TKRRLDNFTSSLGAFDRAKGALSLQIARGLRHAILSGEIKPGERVPSTRALASALKASRGTVLDAFDQLLAEGYLDAAIGSGTRVSVTLAEEGMGERAANKINGCLDFPPLPAQVKELAAIARSFA